MVDDEGGFGDEKMLPGQAGPESTCLLKKRSSAQGQQIRWDQADKQISRRHRSG
jgi:hypothetical protein